MYNLYCEHPVIIRHPRLKDLLPVFGSYRTPNGLYDLTPSQCHTWKYRFPEWLFSAMDSEVLKFWEIAPIAEPIKPYFNHQIFCGQLCEHE